MPPSLEQPPLPEPVAAFSWGVELPLYGRRIGLNSFADGKATFQY